MRFALRTWKSPDFHQGKYTKGSPIRQGFVCCNQIGVAEKPKFANDLESGKKTRRVMGNGWVVGRVLQNER